LMCTEPLRMNRYVNVSYSNTNMPYSEHGQILFGSN
jgi:hypothetical protein